MGLRTKLFCGLVIFFVIFGLKFLCANCQQIVDSGTIPSTIVDPTLKTDINPTIVSNGAVVGISGDFIVTDLSALDVGPTDLEPSPSQTWQNVATTESSHELLYPSASSEDDQQTKLQQELGIWPSSEPIGRRRRPGARKRKRRPQSFTTERSGDSKNHWRGRVDDDTTNFRREHDRIMMTISERNEEIKSTTRSPVTPMPMWQEINRGSRHSQRIREPLAALEKEQKLSELRHKQRKEMAAEATATTRDKSYRKPYSQGRREEISTTAAPPPLQRNGAELKNFLKNSGVRSFSEILQQQNLLLDDLLKGKQDALQALRTPSPSFVPSAPGDVDDTFKFQKPVRQIPLSYVVSTTTLATSSSVASLTTEKPSTPIPYTPTSRIPPILILNENIKSAINDSKSVPNATMPRVQSNNKSLDVEIGEEHLEPTSDSNQSVKKNLGYVPSNHRPETTSSEPIINEMSLLENQATVSLLATIASLKENHPAMHHLGRPSKEVITPRPHQKAATAKPHHRWHSGDRTYFDESSHLLNSQSINQESNDKFDKSDTEIDPTTNETLLTVSSYEKNEDSLILLHTKNNDDNKNIAPLPTPVNEEIEHSNLNVNFIKQYESLDEPQRQQNDDSNIDTSELLSEQPMDYSRVQSITPRFDRLDEDAIINSVARNTQKSFANRNVHDVTETNPSLFLDMASERPVDDSGDLLELTEDVRFGSRLFKALAKLNMTMDELNEHRRRGSSQLHFKEMIENQRLGYPFANPRFATTAEERLYVLTAFENFPHFNLINVKSIKPDDIKTDSQGSSYFTSIIDIKPTDEISKEGRSIKNSIEQSQQQNSDEYKSPPNDHSSTDQPDWQDFVPPSISFGSQETNNYIDVEQSQSQTSSRSSSVIASRISEPEDSDIIDSVSRIDDDIARDHDLLDLELSGHGLKRSTITIESAQISTGVRSAMIASSAIVGVSLIIFLIIFITFRWRQRRRNKLTYADHYNAIKNRQPIVPRSSGIKHVNTISPTIFTTSNKNTKLNTMDPNSPEVQEYLFDAMRKPF